MTKPAQSLSAQEINDMVAKTWPLAPVKCLKVSQSTALAQYTPMASDIRPGDILSGPAAFAAADTAFWFAVMGALDRLETMVVTQELSIRFMRPAQGTTLFARAQIDKAGRRTMVATVKVWTQEESKPCAVAQGTYAVPKSASS